MARIRTIKPQICSSEQFVELSPNARLLFVLSLCFFDDGGVHKASAKRLKMEVFPADNHSVEDMQTFIDEILSVGLWLQFEHNGCAYYYVTGWNHQKIDKPTYAYPGPHNPDNLVHISPNTRRTVGDPSPPEGKGRERKGKENTLGHGHGPLDDQSLSDQPKKPLGTAEQTTRAEERPTGPHPTGAVAPGRSDPDPPDEHAPQAEERLNEPIPTGGDTSPGLEQPAVTPSKAKPASRAGTQAESPYPPGFEQCWQLLPKRAGSNPKRAAYHAWRARYRAGVSVEALAQGAERYRKFCEATGKIGTEYVMRGSTFWGPDEHYAQDWALPKQPGDDDDGQQPRGWRRPFPTTA